MFTPTYFIHTLTTTCIHTYLDLELRTPFLFHLIVTIAVKLYLSLFDDDVLFLWACKGFLTLSFSIPFSCGGEQ